MGILDRTNWWRSVAASHEKKRGKFDRPLVLAAAGLLLLVSGICVAADTQEIPVVKAGLGPCSVDFTVEDGSHKPLYDAKIDVTIRYGFLSKRRTDLEVGTNGDGKARFEGLPSKVKKTLEFRGFFHFRRESLEASLSVAVGTDLQVGPALAEEAITNRDINFGIVQRLVRAILHGKVHRARPKPRLDYGNLLRVCRNTDAAHQ